jgi:gliding motility-associated-like protein
LQAQCGSIYISATDTAFCSPKAVTFTVVNYPNNTTFEWDLGLGFVAGPASYSKLYSTGGLFDVKVKMTFQDGSNCTLNYAKFVNSRPNPIPKFSASRLSICSNLDSIIISDITPNTAKRDWLIENNAYNNTGVSIVERLTTPYGYKNMTMFVEDKFGCKGKKSFDSAFYLPPPIQVDFDASRTTGCVPASIDFNNSSVLNGNTISTWNWSFPGSSIPSSSIFNPTGVLYNAVDTYNVKLIGTTNYGCKDSIEKRNYFSFGQSVNITATLSTNNMCASSSLNLTHTNIRNTSPVLNITPSTFTVLSSNANNSIIKFNEPGVYSIEISDEKFTCVSRLNLANAITINGPVAKFSLNENKSCATPDTFLAINKSILQIGTTANVRWELSYDSLPNVVIQRGTGDTIKLIGTVLSKYTVKQVVKGSNGCSDSITTSSAFEIQKMLPAFNWASQPSCPGEMVSFANQTAPGTSKIKNRYQWTFYNLNLSILKRDTAQNPSLSYPGPGRFKVKLLAYNDLGCRDSITLDTVKIIDPTPQFLVSDTNVCFNFGYSSRVKLSAIYPDNVSLTKYRHFWKLNHQDSSKTIYTDQGDTANFYGLLPGIYNISYWRFSNLSGACRDTFFLQQKIRVSGVFYKILLDSIPNCHPFVADLEAVPLYNYNFKNTFGKNSVVKWLSYYDTNSVTIRLPNQENAKAYVKKSGNFRFEFNVNHASGCSEKFRSPTINAGLVARFNTSNRWNWACKGKSIEFINTSDQRFVGYKWHIIDTNNQYKIYPNDSAQNVKMVFNRKGNYGIHLIGYGNGNCNDTFKSIVYVTDALASFTSSDTTTYCAPSLVRLFAKQSNDIIYYKWMVDGDTLNNRQPNIGHVINRNTGPQGLPVALMVSNRACEDTLVIKDFFKVIGPIPKFSLLNNVGCESLNVQFINESKYFSTFYLEYGDGSALDSSSISRHKYRVFDRAMMTQIYKPILSTVDSFGCIANYSNPEVTVSKSPEARFTIDRDSGCADLDVKFRNVSVSAVNFKWDFNSDGVIDNTQFAPNHQYTAGVYRPTLVAFSSNTCSDTFKYASDIKAFLNPNVVISSSKDSICYNSNVSFNATLTTTNSKIKKWNWDFGNNFLQNDTSTAQNPNYTFVRTRLNMVTLLVEDNNFCFDTIEKFIYVKDTTGPKSEPLHFVSVVNNSGIQIQWTKSLISDYLSYKLYRDNSGYSLVYSTNNRNDTTRTITNGVDVGNSRYCYVIKTQDLCTHIGKPNYPHCTILLQVSDSINKLVLSWLPYEGWGNGMVERYRIYKKELNGSFKLVDSTTKTTYVDDRLCPKSYCYYVVAVQKNGIWTSASNEVCKTPKYIKPLEQVKTIRTTVLDNGNTYTHWEPYKFSKHINKYVISRYDDGFGKYNTYALVDSTGYIDDNSNLYTNIYSYTYGVRVEDHCGNMSPESNPNTTVLLKGKSVDYVAKINWTPYQKWESGVKQYDILFRDNSGFKLVGSVIGSAPSLEFDYKDKNIDDSLCFKIRAIKDTSINVESLSNIVCFISDPQMHVPNAFTPNGDGVNDVFIPRSILIFNQTGNPILDYHLEIFNRWGQKVFETDDVIKGWDGTYMGSPCAESAYIYRLRGLGLDGITRFNIEGNVTLLR